MEIFEYTTRGGKNLIEIYFKSLNKKIYLQYLDIKLLIIEKGIKAFELLETRHIYKSIWEIKVADERIFYCVIRNENVYFLHACRKQKNKAEKKDINNAISRAKSEGLL